MINIYEVNETNKMIEKENLDVRTITMGISLWIVQTVTLKKLKTIYITKLRPWQKILLRQVRILKRIRNTYR